MSGYEIPFHIALEGTLWKEQWGRENVSVRIKAHGLPSTNEEKTQWYRLGKGYLIGCPESTSELRQLA